MDLAFDDLTIVGHPATSSRRVVVLVLAIAAVAPVASAEPAPSVPPVAVRVSAAIGELGEVSWQVPDVDLVGSLRVGDRGVVTALAGYSILDNHTYLADGEDYRLQVAGGARVLGELRVSVGLALELIAFNSDPDALAQHPGVDLIFHHRATIPSANLELRYPIGAVVAAGLFARLGLRDLTLFDTGAGDRLDARLVLVGAFIELPIR